MVSGLSGAVSAAMSSRSPPKGLLFLGIIIGKGANILDRISVIPKNTVRC